MPPVRRDPKSRRIQRPARGSIDRVLAQIEAPQSWESITPTPQHVILPIVRNGAIVGAALFGVDQDGVLYEDDGVPLSLRHEPYGDTVSWRRGPGQPLQIPLYSLEGYTVTIEGVGG